MPPRPPGRTGRAHARRAAQQAVPPRPPAGLTRAAASTCRIPPWPHTKNTRCGARRASAASKQASSLARPTNCRRRATSSRSPSCPATAPPSHHTDRPTSHSTEAGAIRGQGPATSAWSVCCATYTAPSSAHSRRSGNTSSPAAWLWVWTRSASFAESDEVGKIESCWDQAASPASRGELIQGSLVVAGGGGAGCWARAGRGR